MKKSVSIPASFSVPFKCVTADELNIYIPNEITKIIMLSKGTEDSRCAALNIVCVVNMLLHENPDAPVTYEQIANMSRGMTCDEVKRGHILLIELGVE